MKTVRGTATLIALDWVLLAFDHAAYERHLPLQKCEQKPCLVMSVQSAEKLLK